ncbi:hypothetical protein [Ruminococcus sp.]|uniref:hypothetical protein n=1 Tax=Ruminococcus sp. TaxID=41978 RepID=UPI0025EE2905|nr:hypothetical protein [Ruminococcus sp.]MBR1431932.1 hypothetical protein [Ruminococcus sp.]MBR1823953.1 hypothetical protein [Ruminococcus sp.]
MNIKRSVSVILAAFCLTAGANIFTANAATVSPEGIAASENVGASKDDQIRDLKAQLADMENRYYSLQNEMADMEANYQHRLRMMEEDLMAAENKYSAARAEADEMETNLNKHIKSLQEENTSLKTNNSKLSNDNSTLKNTVAEYKAQAEKITDKYNAYVNDILRLDVNSDGTLDAADASAILSIYAYNSTNKTPITTISDYYIKRK